MNSDFFKMATQPPMMSTPIKGKYSSLFQDIALLPYRLFGRCSRDKSDAPNMDSPRNGSPIPSGVNMSPCRHSLRLLSNGYYVCDEDSLCWDDLGNISFSPTQCTVSYKENMVRIFRRRRRTLAQRRFDLTNHGDHEDRKHLRYEDMNDIEPLVVEQIYPSSSDLKNLDLCDFGNTNLFPPTLLDVEESDTDHVPSGYSQLVCNENAPQCYPKKSPMKLRHARNSTKMLQPEHNPANPDPPGALQDVNNDPLSPVGHCPFMEERDNGDERLGRCSCSGYLFVNNDSNTCCFTYDPSGPAERRLAKNHSANSIATTLTPSIQCVPMDLDDTRQRRMIPLAIIFIPLFLLCLVFWWVRSPDHNTIQPGI